MTPTSIHHPFLKDIRRAVAAGRPTDDGLIVAEGPHLIEEAFRSFWTIEHILTTPAGAERFASLLAHPRTEVTRIASKTFAQIASTESAQQILGLFRPKAFHWNDLLTPSPALIIVLDAIQDPGNAGTIARSAEAFGASGLVLLEGSVRLANPKFLRASAGSLFRLPILEKVNVAELLVNFRGAKVRLAALTTDAKRDLQQSDLRQSIALVVGNEGAGISADLRHAASPIRIPTGQVESLNAAVACSLALYEAHNQRMANESL